MYILFLIRNIICNLKKVFRTIIDQKSAVEFLREHAIIPCDINYSQGQSIIFYALKIG